MAGLTANILQAGTALLVAIFTALIYRIVYTQFFHPLAAFRGPWYATSFSIVGAIISVKRREPEFLTNLVRKYGTARPIRIAPTVLMFPSPTALKHIYWDAQLNTKGGMYRSGALGPPQIFSTVDGEEHRVLRKALSNAPWTIGQLMKTWEARFDDQITLFIQKMHEHAVTKRTICFSDKVAEFAADIMSMISFTVPFGCVENQRDEKEILTNWRQGLTFFGFIARWRFFRERLVPIPTIGSFFLPKLSDDKGMGWLMGEAEYQVVARERQQAEKVEHGKLDFLQHCLNARLPDGSPLTQLQRRAHITLLIQAGADTTGTALGCILRFLILNPAAMARARAEIVSVEKAGYLSKPIQYEETRKHLPFFVACIKEGLRLNPPAPNLFSRVVPQGGKEIDGHFVAGGMDVTCHAYTVQRDKAFFGEDADDFVPERWMVSEKRNFELEGAQFTFGMGPRICIGKDIAMMEMYKLLPEFVRRFDFELENEGKYVIDAGVGYNEGFMGKLVARA